MLQVHGMHSMDTLVTPSWSIRYAVQCILYFNGHYVLLVCLVVQYQDSVQASTTLLTD